MAKYCEICGNEIDKQHSNPSVRRCHTCKRLLPGNKAAFNRVFKAYQGACAKDRGHRWELTEEQFKQITGQPCHYCGVEPNTVEVPRRKKAEVLLEHCFIYNGIDRVDNSGDYSPDNVVPCCSVCNGAKKAMTYNEFIAWLDRIVEFRR